MTLIHRISLICALELIWFLNPVGTVIDAKTTQPSSIDCAEGEDVNLPCNNYTIGGNDYIHWFQQNPNQSPQYVIHSLWSTVNSSMASLNTASDSTLVLPQVTMRDTAVYYCVLREAHWGGWGCTCAVFLWWPEGGTQWGSSHESKSRVIWKKSQRAVRDEGNEGKEKGRRCIKKISKGGQGSGASLVDVAEKNYGC